MISSVVGFCGVSCRCDSLIRSEELVSWIFCLRSGLEVFGRPGLLLVLGSSYDPLHQTLRRLNIYRSCQHLSICPLIGASCLWIASFRLFTQLANSCLGLDPPFYHR